MSGEAMTVGGAEEVRTRLALALDTLAQGTVPASLTAVAPRFVELKSGVSKSLTVRQSATTSSASIGTIAARQRAELLGPIPRQSPSHLAYRCSHAIYNDCFLHICLLHNSLLNSDFYRPFQRG